MKRDGRQGKGIRQNRIAKWKKETKLGNVLPEPYVQLSYGLNSAFAQGVTLLSTIRSLIFRVKV